jgi:MoaA/NifB/PqqE/SkfB family radical SAM enzyme
MEIKGIHLLLTYQCNFRCDHCFVWGCPEARGVMTISDIAGILKEASRIGTIAKVFFEGGEPFLYYPVMLRGIREARVMGFDIGVVTNAYWATSREDALEWLGPMVDAGLSDLSISDDVLHSTPGRPANAREAAAELSLPAGSIVTEDPREQNEGKKGGSVMFRGRAVEKLTESMPREPWAVFTECNREKLENPSRVHLDPMGFVHICQGLAIGNFREKPLSEIVEEYDPWSHPVCSPILERGPVGLVERYDVPHAEDYVDECHLCYCARLALRDRFPEYLAPDQMYGQLDERGKKEEGR